MKNTRPILVQLVLSILILHASPAAYGEVGFVKSDRFTKNSGTQGQMIVATEKGTEGHSTYLMSLGSYGSRTHLPCSALTKISSWSGPWAVSRFDSDRPGSPLLNPDLTQNDSFNLRICYIYFDETSNFNWEFKRKFESGTNTVVDCTFGADTFENLEHLTVVEEKEPIVIELTEENYRDFDGIQTEHECDLRNVTVKGAYSGKSF